MKTEEPTYQDMVHRLVTERERSKVALIRRESDRGYMSTLKDLRLLLELLERFGI